MSRFISGSETAIPFSEAKQGYDDPQDDPDEAPMPTRQRPAKANVGYSDIKDKYNGTVR